MKPVIYIVGSLRNADIPRIGNQLEEIGWEAFTDWHSAGPEADDYWQKHERERGRDYRQALKGYHANHVFDFDYHHLNRSHAGLLVVPCGKSCHLELGYLRGQQKPVFVLFQEPPKDGRWDIMYVFCKDVFFSQDEMLLKMKEYASQIKENEK